MKQLGWTSIEQSEKLVEAGLDPNTADMGYVGSINTELSLACYTDVKERFKDKKSDFFKVTPCWSLRALIELMPEETLYMQMDNYWTITFDRDEEHIDQFSNKILIETLCEAIEWMLENNIINKKAN